MTLNKVVDRHTIAFLQMDAAELSLKTSLACLLDEVEMILHEKSAPLYSRFLLLQF